MIKPSCDEIMELAKSYNTIPVCKEILADVITPITLLRRIAASKKRFFLLESIEGGEKWGRYYEENRNHDRQPQWNFERRSAETRN